MAGSANWPAASTIATSFDLYPAASPGGVDRLDPNLTINGATVTPTFRYKGGDADGTDWVAWTYGNTLTAQGVGGVFGDGSPLHGSSNDDAVDLATGRTYDNASTTYGNVSTNDFVFEGVLRAVPANPRLISKMTDVSFDGWLVYSGSSSAITLRMDDGSTAVTPATAALDSGSWYHVMVFVDRSGSAQWYVNGAASGSPVVVSAVGDIDVTDDLNIGAINDSASNPWSGPVAYLALWDSNAWLDTHLQAAVAKERFAKLTGLWPNVAKGTPVPNTITRATSKTFEKATAGVTKLFTVGDNWIPVARIDHDADSTADATGLLIEAAATNSCLQSEDPGGTSWTLNGTDTQSADGTAWVNGETTADGNIGSATAGQHGPSQAVTLTAATWTFSAFAKAGDMTWVQLFVTTIGANAYFDTSDCSVGTSGSVIDTFAEDWGGGWCRFGISYTGVAAARAHNLYTAEADGDNIFSGDAATVNTWWNGIQVEANDHMSSYIATTTTGVTRNADQLQYAGLANVGGAGSNLAGSAAVSYWYPPHTETGFPYLWSLSDGGSSLREIFMDGRNTNVMLGYSNNSGSGATITGTSDVMDGVVHTSSFTWGTNDFELFVDGVSEGTPDTSGTVGANLDELDIGQSRAGAQQMNGIIERLRIWPRARKVPAN